MDPDVKQSWLPHVSECFPADGELIEQLAGENEVFTSVCEDYALLLVTLGHLEGDTKTADPKCLADYRFLKATLKAEIDWFLQLAKASLPQ